VIRGIPNATRETRALPSLKSIAARQNFPFSVHDPFSVVSGPSSPRLRRGKLIDFFRIRSETILSTRVLDTFSPPRDDYLAIDEPACQDAAL
jgi:hypothetical protein